MKLLTTLLLLSFPLGQLARWEPFGNEVALHLNDFAVGIVVLFWFLKNPKVALKQIRSHRLSPPLLFWVLAMFGSLFLNIFNLSGRELLISSLHSFRFLAYASLFFVFNSMDPKPTKKLLLLAALSTALIGLGQFYFLPDVSFLAQNNWDDHYFRLVSTFLDPGFTGAILALGLLVAFLSNFHPTLTLPILYVAMMLTYSRASYLMYLVSFLVIAILKKSARIFVISALILLVTLPFLPKSSGEGTRLNRENSILARINNWKISLEIWQTKPLTGVGFNAYRYALRDAGKLTADQVRSSHAGSGADSSLILVLTTTGPLGLAAFLFLLLRLWQNCPHVLFRASLVGVVIHSFFNNTLFYPWIAQWLWILLASKEKT